MPDALDFSLPTAWGVATYLSKRNFSADRYRRSFVGHYCNARAFTQRGADEANGGRQDPVTGMTNGSHILARGDTHLSFARPRFGTPCVVLWSPEERRRESGHAADRLPG